MPSHRPSSPPPRSHLRAPRRGSPQCVVSPSPHAATDVVAAHKRLHHPPRQQLHFMTKLLPTSRPVLRSAARFHADQTPRTIRKMLQNLLPLKLQRHNLARLGLHPMQLKHTFCDIHSNHDTIHVGPSGCL